MPEQNNVRRYRYTDLSSVHHGVVVSQPGGAPAPADGERFRNVTGV